MRMTVRGRVKNGRLVVDEPTSLPEGTEVELVSVDGHEAWDLTDEQVAALRESIAEADRGELTPSEEVLRGLRSAR